MFRLDLLPYWNVTNLKPAFYDVESCSAIGQTARVYGAMNKLIESYNEWINQVNKSILEFNESTDQDIDCFKRAITELCNNYIKTMDMKIEHQDREIEESITYIKENITASVRNVVNEMKESGELAEELLATFEELSQKVNGLETFLNGEAEKIVLLTQDNETNKQNIETNKIDISNLKIDNETNKTRLDNLEIYSTEEKVKGEWIDGKPLYRKVIDFGSMPTTFETAGIYSKSVDIGIPCENITKIIGNMSKSNIFAPIPFAGVGNDSVTFYINGTSLTVQSQTIRTDYVAKFIIEYTKTTD